MAFKELKEKTLKLFEETDRQEACIQDLKQRLYLAEKVCFAAYGYLKCTETPLDEIYLNKMKIAVEKWDSYRESKGSQYIVTEQQRGRLSDMAFKELKEKTLKLFEETDRQEACIQELRQRLYLVEKVCFDAYGYLKSNENPLDTIYLNRMKSAVEKWDIYREIKGIQYIVTEED